MQKNLIIVTGAGSPNGIGFAISKLLSSQEVETSIVLTDIDAGRAKARAKDICNLGYDAVGLGHDISKDASWRQLINEISGNGNQIIGLVNNAGLAILKPLLDLSVEEIETVCQVNLVGTALGCRHVVAQMRANRVSGSIVNISSVSAVEGFKANAAYGATKGGITSLTRHVAAEVATHGIRCNSVTPGAIWTDIQIAAQKQNPQLREQSSAQIPLRRIGQPDDVAHMVDFLLSTKACYITGADFVVDGGLTSISPIGA